MKNEFIDSFKKIITIKVNGRSVDNFIRKIMNKNIELLNIKYLSSKEVRIKIYQKDLEKIEKYKSIYEVNIYKYHGLLKIKDIIGKQKMLFSFIIIGFLILIVLSNIISNIEIVHTNTELRTLLKNNLEEKGLKKNRFKKTRKQIDKIKREILYKYKTKIEWLEIEEVGTKYIVRVEQRKIKKQKIETEKHDIVSSKDAIIRKINTKSGVTIKNVNDYVTKGDIIITGNVMLNEELKDVIDAEGVVYGEVWYKVSVNYPFVYMEETLTGKTNNVYSFTFINKKIEIFNKKKYKNKKIKENVILKNSFIPVKLSKEKQKEVKVIKQFSTEADAINQAKEVAREKIKKTLGVNEYIISEKNLKVTSKDSKIVLDMFISVYENITEKKPVKKIEVENEENVLEKEE
jgi:Putative stage IV sporulation protein YqfD.